MRRPTVPYLSVLIGYQCPQGERADVTEREQHNRKHLEPILFETLSQVIPAFRAAAAALLGERWASARPGWYQPGGDKPSFISPIDNHETRIETGGSVRSDRAHSRDKTPSTPVIERGAGEGSRARIGKETPPPSTTPPPSCAGAASASPAAALTADAAGSREDDDRDHFPLAPSSEPSRRGVSGGGGGGGGEGSGGRDGIGDGSSGSGRGDDSARRKSKRAGIAFDCGDDGEANAGGNIGGRRPFTTERNNAKDLAQHLGVGGGDNGRDNDSGRRRGGTGRRVGEGDGVGGKGGIGGFLPKRIDEASVAEDEDKKVKKACC